MKVELEDYAYECGDGCCTEYGTILYINDEVYREFWDDISALEHVLTEFFNVTVCYKFTDEQD